MQLWVFKHYTFSSGLWVYKNLGDFPKDRENPKKEQVKEKLYEISNERC